MRNHRRTRVPTLLYVLVLALSPSSPAKTISVDDDGPADYTTIQAAIDAAVDGDAVIVQPGTYTGVGNRDISFKGKAITVRGVDPNDSAVVATTIIACQQFAAPAPDSSGGRTGTEAGVRAFLFRSGEGSQTVVEGLTVINGGMSGSGGAIWCELSSPRISQCVFRSNQCSARGGAIFIEDGSPCIEKCVFGQNLADEGGAIACSSSDGTVRIVNCIIQDNQAELSGGGLHCGSGVIVSGCLIVRNSARSDSPYYWPDARYPSGGGGIFLEDDGPVLENCTIVANVSPTGSAVLLGCRLDASGKARLYNCIIWGNGDDASSQISLSPCCGICVRAICPVLLRVYHSCIQGTPSGLSTAYQYIEDDACLHTDPFFVDPCAGDFRLRGESPCIDGGSNDLSGGLMDVDLDGSPRLVDCDVDGVVQVDMGHMSRVLRRKW